MAPGKNLTELLPAKRSFAERLRDYRQRRGLSQNQLARRSGIDFAYVNRLEGGQRIHPAREVVLSLARELELTYLEREVFLWSAGLSPEEDWQTRAQIAEACLSKTQVELGEYVRALRTHHEG